MFFNKSEMNTSTSYSSQKSQASRPTKRSGRISLKNFVLGLKSDIESKLQYQLCRPLVKQIKCGEFAQPARAILDKHTSSLEKCETISVSTAEPEPTEVKSKASASEVTQNRDDMNSIIESCKGEKKLKTVLNFLTKFEELCVEGAVVNADGLRSLNFYHRAILSKIVNGYDTVIYQHSESLCLAIVFVSTSKVGISKKTFLGIAKKLIRRKKVRLSSIRKSKCFSLLNNLLNRNQL